MISKINVDGDGGRRSAAGGDLGVRRRCGGGLEAKLERLESEVAYLVLRSSGEDTGELIVVLVMPMSDVRGHGQVSGRCERAACGRRGRREGELDRGYA